MKRYKVLHLVNKLGFGSNPFDHTRLLDSRKFEVIVCSYYDNDETLSLLAGKTDKKLIGLNARSRFDLQGYIKLYRVIRDTQPDIIHTHHHLTGIIGRILGRLGHVPIVVHNFESVLTGFTLGSRVLHILTFPFLDWVVCVSRSVEQSFSAYEKIFLRGRKTIITNGVDVGEIDVYLPVADGKREELGLAREDFILGNVARLVPQKDQSTLIRAISKVVVKAPEIKLIIVGGGEQENSLRKLVRDLGVGDRVIFTGSVDRAEVYKLLHIMDVFVMTSLWEGFCVALLQAMAAGKPVIVTDIPAFREAIEDGVSGKVVRAKNPEALAEAVLELKNKPEVARQMGEAARKRVIEKFSMDKTIKGYEQLYLELLEKRR